MRWREENRSALLQPASGAGARESIESGGGGGSGPRPGSAGVSSLGQLLRQKYWQQDARVMQSADTQDSNVLGGAVVTADRREEDDSVLADLPPSYTSKTTTFPLDSTPAGLEDEETDWQSPHHDEPVHSIEFDEESGDEVPDFQDSPLAHSDMVASGSSQLAPVSETAIDADYELITIPHHHHHGHDQSFPRDLDVRSSHSPVTASLHPSRHASPAPSDSSVSHHRTPMEPRPGVHTPVDSRSGVASGVLHAHKPPPPPPPPRRIHVEEDIPTVPMFDPFESLPPPAEMMLGHEELEGEVDLEETGDEHGEQLYSEDEPSSGHHPYWHASKPTDL